MIARGIIKIKSLYKPYEENGEYIVYKNKDDGTRAVRYKGKDEAYAVNEVYLKLKSEILNQKTHNINNRNIVNGTSNQKGNSNNILAKFFKLNQNLRFLSLFLSMIMLLIVVLSLMRTDLSVNNGFSNQVADITTYTDSSSTDDFNAESSNWDSDW